MPKKMPARGRPRDPSTEKAILRAALALFIERGIDGVSIEGIAKRAGVTRPAIYRRWSSKEPLLARAIEAARDHAAPSTEQLADILPKLKSGEFVSRFIDMAADGWSKKEFRQLAIRLIGAQLTCPELVETYRNTYVEPRWKVFLTMLERMRDEGRIPKSTDINSLAHMIGGAMIYRLLFISSSREWSRAQIRFFLVRLLQQAGLGVAAETGAK